MRQILKRLRQEERPSGAKRRAQAYTEFVVVLPGVLLVLLLAWEFSYFWWSRMVVSTATFEAARTVATGGTAAEGAGVYGSLTGGSGEGFALTVQPGRRSVYAETNVPWHWPSGLGALMGGGMNLDLKASAFFRLEQFWPGPPGAFE